MQKNGKLFKHSSEDLGHCNRKDNLSNMNDAKYYFDGVLNKELILDLTTLKSDEPRLNYLKAILAIKKNILSDTLSNSSRFYQQDRQLSTPSPIIDNIESFINNNMLQKKRKLYQVLPLSERLAIHFCGKLKRKAPKTSGQGNKCWKICLNSQCILVEATRLLGVKGFSLRQLSEITQVADLDSNASKGFFPHSYLKEYKQLYESSLPYELRHWETNIGSLAILCDEQKVLRTGTPSERLAMQEKEQKRLQEIAKCRDQAIYDFNLYGCKSIFSYMLVYLYRDLRSLLRSMEVYRKQMSQVVEHDYLLSNHLTLPSFSSW